MRRRIYEIIDEHDENDKLGDLYDTFMIICIALSVIPMCFKTIDISFEMLERDTAIVFIVDYFLRLITADYKLNRGGDSFVVYPFTFMAIVDLIAILPSLSLINQSWKILRIFRLGRTFRVFKAVKVFKAFRYSKNIDIIVNVFKKQEDSLIIVGMLAVGYIFMSALVVFNVEPDTFGNFYDALYWATGTLTTIGYTQVYTTSIIGRFVTMVSALVGIAVVALPAGIITAGYMEELNHNPNKEDE